MATQKKMCFYMLLIPGARHPKDKQESELYLQEIQFDVFFDSILVFVLTLPPFNTSKKTEKSNNVTRGVQGR